MDKHKKLALIISLAVVVIFGVISLALLGKVSPFTEVISDVQNNQCEKLAKKVLQAKKAAYPFHRCEQEIYKAANSNKSVTKVYVVAGAVESQWEFECGFMAECETFVGWFDNSGKLFNFTEPPQVANHDPAVYTLGCGDENSSSDNDVEVEPALVFERGKFWWRIDYDMTPTSNLSALCKVSGISLIGYKEVLSSLKADYPFDVTKCSESSTCQTAKALRLKSPEPCEYKKGNFIVSEYTGANYQYDYDCASNYVSHTGDTSICGASTNYGELSCKDIVFVRKI